MKIRGRRRCKECDHRWSYYETGSVSCPACGSLLSVGVDEARALHTDAPAELDLAAARRGIDERSIREVAADAGDAARDYLLSRGFIDGGELLSLDEPFVAAAELRHAADVVRRSLDLAEDAERYFLVLLAGADGGDRPDEVPDSMREAYGLAMADAVDAYRADLATWLDEYPDPEARAALGRLREHGKRVGALDGDVPPAEADRLVAAARDLGAYVRKGNEDALARAGHRLARLE